MTPAIYDIEIVRGLDWGPVTIVCRDAASAIVDLTGWSVEAHARKTRCGTLFYNLAPTISDPTGGEITIPTITAAVSDQLCRGRYGWDLVLITPAGRRQGPYITGAFGLSEIYTHLT
jgi:hypothetical protein